MGSEGSHNIQNDTPFAPRAKQRKNEGKRVALQAKVNELEAQNNKIAMKNEVFQEQYEKLFETLYENRCTQTGELIAPVDINHHLGAPQHRGSPPFDMGIPNEEQVNHQNIDQHETSFNLDASTQSRRSGGRHLLAEGLGPFPRPRLAANLGKERQVLEKHEGTGDFELLEEVNKLKAQRQAEIPDWNQPRPSPLTRRILDTPSKRRQNKSLVYNFILEGRTQLNTLTSLSPPWHIGYTPTKSDVLSSPPPSLAEL
ncbi:hypothetical protein ACFX1T_019378 [Malus domestica]